MEYTWSGFELNYGVVPVERTHNLAVAFQVLAFNLAMAKGYNNIDVIAHSWGTCLTYDAIVQSGLYISNWVTMGSPLRADTSRPNVGRWIDFYSNTDPVTWLNCFPPFPQIDTGSLQAFTCSLIPLAPNVTLWQSAIRVNAFRENVTDMVGLGAGATIWSGVTQEHVAYWLYPDVVQSLVEYLR